MATRRARKQTPEPADDLEFADDLDIVSVLQDELGSSDDVKIEVYQITPDSGSTGAYAFSILPEQAVTLKDYTRDNWGAGKYRVIAKRLNGRYIKQWRFQVATPLNALPKASPIGTPPAQAADTETNRLLRTVLEKLSAPPPPPPAGASIIETLTALKTYNELIAPKTASVGITETLNALKSWHELMTPGGVPVAGGDESPLERILGKVLPLFQPIVEKIAAGELTPPAAPPAAALPAPAAPPPAALPGADDIQAVMNYLLAQAAAGADPKFSAQYVLDRLPENILDVLDNTDDPVGALAAYFPAVAQHRAWFDALINNLYEEPGDVNAADPKQHQDADPGRGGGNAGSPEANAGAHAPGPR